MNKVVSVLTIMVIITLGITSTGCDVLSNDSDSTEALKEVGSFPMEVGTAWVYETEESGSGYTQTRIDTLFLFDTYENYYALSFEPFQEAMLLNQDGPMVADVGYADEGGNVEIYDTPYLQFMYKETDGFVSTSNYSDYSWWGAATYLKVTLINDMEINGTTYEDVYEMIISSDKELSSTYGKAYYNSQGLLKYIEHDESDGTYHITSNLTKILTNTYPDSSIFSSVHGKSLKSVSDAQHSFMGSWYSGINR